MQTISRRVTLTLKELGFLTAPSRTCYALEKHHIHSLDVVGFVLCIAMKIDDGSYYSFAGLNEFYLLFPFEYTVSKEAVGTRRPFRVD